MWASQECAAPCGNGTYEIVRECINGQPGEIGCEGEAVKIGTCYAGVS